MIIMEKIDLRKTDLKLVKKETNTEIRRPTYVINRPITQGKVKDYLLKLNRLIKGLDIG